MPDVLAIHWERRRLRVIEASIGSSVRVLQGFTIDVPEAPSASWLRDALRKQGVTAKQTIVALPREDAILRQLELPNAPDDELPSLVYFQASTRSTTPLEQLLLDFLPMPQRGGTELKDVLLASVARSALEPIRAALTDAGLDLVALTLSSFALAEFALRLEATQNHAASRRSLVVLADGHRLEVVLVGQQQPLAAHMVRAPLDDNGRPIIAKAAADVSRVLVPAQAWLTDSSIERICIVGDSPEWQAFPRSEALGERWSCSVERFDANSKTTISDLDATRLNSSPASFATALGLVLSRLHPRAPSFDLLHPRQPKPKRDPRKLQLAVGSAAALLVIALGTSIVQLSMMSLETQIEAARKAERDRTAELKKGEPTLAAAKAITEWTKHDINQIRQLSELNELMQGTSRLYVSDYNFSQFSSSGDAMAKLLASGNARDRQDAQLVRQRFVDSQHFRVKPRESNQQSRDPDYSVRFELDTELLSPGKAPAAAAGSTSPKTK